MLGTYVIAMALILGVLCLLLTLPSTATDRTTERPTADA